MVVRTGFEPIQRESKSLVLPLHYRAIKIYLLLTSMSFNSTRLHSNIRCSTFTTNLSNRRFSMMCSSPCCCHIFPYLVRRLANTVFECLTRTVFVPVFVLIVLLCPLRACGLTDLVPIYFPFLNWSG